MTRPEKDYYRLLGIEASATADDVKRAYRAKALEHHPDRNRGAKHAEEQFKEIGEAYGVLSDPARRRRYDLGRRILRERPHARPHDFRESTRHPRDPRWERDDFGAGADRMPRGTVVIPVTVTFRTAALGGIVDAVVYAEGTCIRCGGDRIIARPGCPMCHGHGRIAVPSGFGTRHSVRCYCVNDCNACAGTGRARATLRVRVPPGMRDGTVVRCGGRMVGRPGTPDLGELHLRVQVAPDANLRFQGERDIAADKALSPVTLERGRVVTVPSLEGPLKIRIRPETAHGSVYVVRGRGAGHPDGERGDLRITIRDKDVARKRRKR